MYILRIKGNGKIPDYLQIRDDNFTLIAYFKGNNIEANLRKVNLELYIDEIKEIVKTLEFGDIKYFNNK